jgi:hypothetical protein
MGGIVAERVLDGRVGLQPHVDTQSIVKNRGDHGHFVRHHRLPLDDRSQRHRLEDRQPVAGKTTLEFRGQLGGKTLQQQEDQLFG